MQSSELAVVPEGVLAEFQATAADSLLRLYGTHEWYHDDKKIFPWIKVLGNLLLRLSSHYCGCNYYPSLMPRTPETTRANTMA